jgi:predicted metal-dependent peptidase
MRLVSKSLKYLMGKERNMETFKSPIVGEVNKWKQLMLIPRHAKEWDNIKTAILYSYGAFGGILYKMMVTDNGEKAWFTDQMKATAGTDDKVLYINPARFFLHNLKQCVFIVCHEIFHAMLNHCGIFHRYRKLGKIAYPDGKTLPYVEEVMQCAADCIINACLVHCHIGEMPKGCYYKPHLVPHTMALLDAYRVIYKTTHGGDTLPKGQGGGGVTNDSEDDEGPDAPSTDNDDQAPFDQHLTPGKGRGKTPNEAMDERNKVEWDAAITAARHTMKAMGVGSAGIDRMFGKITEPEYDWVSVLRHCFNRVVGTGRETWEFLDPEFVVRGIGAPGRLSYGAGFVVVANDSSGSIDDDMLSTFMGHTGIIIDDVRPKELLVTQCDDMIHQWQYIENGSELPRKVLGGGGTSFVPVFDRIEAEQLIPDVVIYFTDMYGTFPSKAPSYPVIWASITKDIVAPFGETIYIPLQKQKVWQHEYE